MTISNTTRKAGPYNGNGVTISFPFAFKVFASSDLQVIRTSVAGVDTNLVLDSTYTASLNSDQDTNPGGAVTVSPAIATGEKITIVGNTPFTQPTDITNGSGFYASVIEASLDRVVALIQQVLGKTDRAMRLPASDAALPIELPTASVRAGKALVFDKITGQPGLSTSAYDDQAGAAAGSAAAAAASATASAGSATAAAGSALSAQQSATNAALDAQSALSSAGAAFTSAGNAATSAGQAAASATTAANLLDNFDDRYLGPKASDPTLDNDGNPLLNGALYFNTTIPQMLVYNTATTSWGPFTNNTVRNGAGTPGAGVGFNGDFYLDTVNYLIYGPKTGGVWGAGTSLIGPSGPGTGDLSGPASSANDAVLLFNGTTGKIAKQSTLTATIVKIASGIMSAATAAVDYVAPGLIASANGLTMNTNRLLGRTTAGVGQVQEITPGPGMSFTGGVLDVVPPGSVLLATITTTAAVNVDALSLFSSTYDSYLVTGQGIRASTGFNNMLLQFANAGVVDTGSNYQSRGIDAGSYSAAATSVAVIGVSTSAGGANFKSEILNANGTTTFKSAVMHAESQNNVPAYVGESKAVIYSATNAISGLRLSMSGGASFVAGGVIRVYGIKN